VGRGLRRAEPSTPGRQDRRKDAGKRGTGFQIDIIRNKVVLKKPLPEVGRLGFALLKHGFYGCGFSETYKTSFVQKNIKIKHSAQRLRKPRVVSGHVFPRLGGSRIADMAVRGRL